ncbi:MAG: ChbG/HpnK family deacetylase [Caldilineaceae bacterium]|nr:ChbG/HpnK family deacetylase [Caldilineaceae bacterium]
MDILAKPEFAGRRVVVVHHDDLGVSHAANVAHRALTRFPSGSIMMTTAWAAEWAGDTDHDLGVHLTLTSEWKSPRYRPITCGPSLRDSRGYLWPTVEEAWAKIVAAEAEAEMCAQIEAALALDIDVTHIDAHMGVVLRPDLAEIYHRLAREYRILAFLPDPVALGHMQLPATVAATLQSMTRASSLPKFRPVDGYSGPPNTRADWLSDMLSALEPGLYHFIHHAAITTPESQAFPDWETRQADFDALQARGVNAVLDKCVLTTYRELRDMLRDAGEL